MSIEIIDDFEKPFVVQLVLDRLDVQEVVDSQRELYLSPDCDPTRPVLWDNRQVDVQPVASEIFKMVEQSTSFWAKMAGGRTAILVSKSENLSFARLYVKLAAAMPRKLKVFLSYDDATEWLLEDQVVSTPKAS
ncbi:MAG: hypothetical protein ACI8Z1_001503 [Candidatus Azotimanducaceae bacterium]|jgi:hypothetical protein